MKQVKKQIKIPSKLFLMDSHGSFYNENKEDVSIFFEVDSSDYIIHKNGIDDIDPKKYIQMFLFILNKNYQFEYTSWNLTNNDDVKIFNIQQLERICNCMNTDIWDFKMFPNRKKLTEIHYMEYKNYMGISMCEIEFNMFKEACKDVLEKGKSSGNVEIMDKKLASYYIFQNWCKVGFYDQRYGTNFMLNRDGMHYYKKLIDIN
jgi:hypothetical protein